MANEITTHKIDGHSLDLKIVAVDEPGAGGAHHIYDVSYDDDSYVGTTRIKFQKGPVKEAGKNGLSNEALLAIVAHRLQCFQDGPFRCEANEAALGNVFNALEDLLNRTRERLLRGVEGTNTL